MYGASIQMYGAVACLFRKQIAPAPDPPLGSLLAPLPAIPCQKGGAIVPVPLADFTALPHQGPGCGGSLLR